MQKCKRSKGRTFTVVVFSSLKGLYAFRARNELVKAVKLSGRNNAGVRSPQPPEANGGSPEAAAGGKRCGEFYSFFIKYVFLSILWSKFLLETRF